ncbi:MAG TPA: phosphoesterase [Pricia antarctica]|uniref:Phosphoesterase n=2 Tax=root TaxID=1 RepID=A0A831VNK1_9FLAO|nr:phosphoesterase [Pricia antarctica]
MKQKLFIFLWILLFFTGCATYKAKYAEGAIKVDTPTKKEVSHTVYLVGDAGQSPMGGMKDALKLFKKKLDSADANSTAIFLGDNIYPAGMPDPKDSTESYRRAKNDIDAQLKTLENFKGKPFFIPGNHDWYTEGLVGLKRQQEYIQKALNSEEVFFPEDGCPIKTIEVNDDIAIIVLDTEWYLTNWNKRPDINNHCDIKSRNRFWLELEDAIKNNRQRTTIIAMHHPMFTYGQHGGQFTFRKNFYPKGNIGPVPVLGTLINILRKTTGASSEDQQNRRYIEMKKRLITLAQYSENLILASGHEHALQYIVEDNTPQIVSGAGSKMDGTRLLNGTQFSTGRRGYAILEVYSDGSAQVDFFAVNEEDDAKEDFMFTTEVLPPKSNIYEEKFPNTFPATAKANIYSKEEIKRSRFFKWLWGNRYRKYYATEVTAPTVLLDTLMGGLKPLHTGGGHQSKSLRLVAKNGSEYVMRALKKDAELYLQAMAFQNKFVIGDFDDTFTEKLLLDFYTGSHPYAALAMGELSDAIGLYHTNPKLYYIPKQPALEDFNEDFGNELYLLEEHAGDGHGNLKSFGYSDDLKSTDTMLEDLRDDEKYDVDTKLYLRARLFDMAIGDWDRHVDQWRWAEFKDKESGKILYKPVPRDRDMAFSKHGDGFLMRFATRVVPALRLMEGFNDEIRNVKGFNSSPKTYVLDMALLTETTLEDWEEQARFIRENLTDEAIDKALSTMPEEVQDETIPEIKRKLVSRLADLEKTAKTYYRVLNKYAVVIGTDKDDWFEINVLNSNQTEIKVFRNIKGKKEKLFFQKKFDKADTKEIWVYGLDDDDRFEVNGENRSPIKTRLIGGQNNDIYDFENGSNIAVYDYRSKDNTFTETKNAKVRLTDDYETNTYLPLELRNSSNMLLPTIGYNPDDGVKIGFQNTYTYKGFRKNPFTQQHKLDAAFYFATSGFELGYSGEYAHVFENWNLETAARFTSPNFSINFFDFGNESENLDDDLGFDYNRVRLQTFRLAPSLIYRWPLGAEFKTGVIYEEIEVEETQDRFINSFYIDNGEESSNSFVGLNAEYSYANFDNEAFPTMGMATSLSVGYKTNLDNGANFGYIVPSFSLDYKLIPNGRLVLASKWKAHFNIGDDYEFYQAASIGGFDGLRGFRNQRFTGKKAFDQRTDIRFSLREVRTELLPVTMGIYGGFDYGRVWQPSERSDIWHTSYGGGFFLNGADILSARVALFNSEDGLRFSFGLGFGF